MAMIGTPQFDKFISENRWAVVVSLRKDGTPTSSMNAYARDGDTLVVSTQGHRLKTKTLRNDPRILLCVINNAEPFNYVSVEGTCVVETENLVEATKMVFANIKDAGYPEPPNLEQWLKEQGRVILRVTPTRVSGVIRG
jgi:PPOX class probable F420-dependent enzyme